MANGLIKIIPKRYRFKIQKFWHKTIMQDYPIFAIIRSKRRGGSIIILDWLKRIDKTTFQRLRTGETFEAPNYKQVDITAGGGNFLELWNPEVGIYTPISFSENEKNVYLTDTSVNYVNWAREKTREIAIKYMTKKKGFEAYMPVVLILMFGVAIMLILFGVSENWTQLGPIADSLREVAHTLEGVGSGSSSAIKPLNGG